MKPNNGRTMNTKSSQGLSLIELLVSITLGLIIVGGLTHSYSTTKTNYQLNTALTTMHSEAHYALNHIISETQQAGFLGETIHYTLIQGTSPPVAANGTCKTNNKWARMIEQPVYGLNDNVKLSSTINYTGCISKKDYLRGDIITLRSASQQIISADQAKKKPNKDRLYLLSSPEKGLIFQGQDLDKNSLASPLQSLRELQASAYYIGPAIGGDNNTCKDNQQPYSSLFRETLNSKGKPQRQEISQGIENIQIQFGIDSNGDKTINNYVDSTSSIQWDQVIAVRVWILARASCPEAGFKNTKTYILGDQKITPSDQYQRLLLSTTIPLVYR